MKRYIYPCVYRRQQIFKSAWSKSEKEAAKKLGISLYQVKMYCRESTDGDYFDGVYGHFDSGLLWEKEINLFMKLMPINQLLLLVDKYTR